MIGLVLISHGQLAVELRRSLETVSGAQSNLATVCVDPHDHPDERRAAVARAIAETDDGAGVIVAADLFGATPCNLAVSLAGKPEVGRPNVDVIAGVNLPMLVEIAKARCVASLPECVARATAAGRLYIASASHVLAHTDIQTDAHSDQPGYSPYVEAGLGLRAGDAASGPSKPYATGSAAAHRAAMAQNADAPSPL